MTDEDSEHQTTKLGDFTTEETGVEERNQSGSGHDDVKDSGDDSLEILDFEKYTPNSGQSEMSALTEGVLQDYATIVDPALLDLGWHLAGAKTAAYGKVEQSMINHIRNGVYALVRLAEIAENLPDVLPPTEVDLRQAIACVVIHDYHKFNDIGWDDDKSEFNIKIDEIRELVDSIPLSEFLRAGNAEDSNAHLEYEDYRAAAVDHHRSDAAMPEVATPTYDDIYPLVRVADGIASKPGPEEAATGGIETDLERAFPTAESAPILRYHRIDDLKGVVTNLLNGVIADALKEEWGVHVWTIYQDGIVYVQSGTAGETEAVPKTAIPHSLYKRLSEIVPESHRRFGSPPDLATDLQFRNAKALYVASGEDYLYNGAETVVRAIAHRALADAPIDEEPTPTQVQNIELLDAAEFFPRSFNATERVYGLLKLINTLRKEIINPVRDSNNGRSEVDLLCEVFGLSDTELLTRLEELVAQDDVLADQAWTESAEITTEEYDLTAGGKWDLGYPIAQAYLDANPSLKKRHRPGIKIVEQVAGDIIQKLDEMFPDWQATVSDTAGGDTKAALKAYIADTTIIDGKPLAAMKTGQDVINELNDPYEQVTGRYRRKLCSFCTRPVVATSFDDLQTSGDVTTFSSGYTRYRAVGSTHEDGGRPACKICQMEFNLRETTTSNRGGTESDRLFVHLVPDYFYTPFSWAAGQTALRELSDDACTQLSQLAEAVFEATTDLSDGPMSNRDKTQYSDAINSIESSLTVDQETASLAQPMIESLDAGYNPEIQFGTRALSYYKAKENETEFQFFGLFAALGVAVYTGTRAVVTDNPIPTITGRDFDSIIRIGTGITKVSSLYGDEITLAELPSRMQTVSALIVLGYKIQDVNPNVDFEEDSRFAGYVRTAHEKLFPGSYFLKRAAQLANANEQAPPLQYIVEELLPYASVLDQLQQRDVSTKLEGSVHVKKEDYRHHGAVTNLQQPPTPIGRPDYETRTPVPELGSELMTLDPPVPKLDAVQSAAPKSTPVPETPQDTPTPPRETIAELCSSDNVSSDGDHTHSAQNSSTTTDTISQPMTDKLPTETDTEQTPIDSDNSDSDTLSDGGQQTTDTDANSDSAVNEGIKLDDVSIPAGGETTGAPVSNEPQGDAHEIIGRLAATAFEIIRPTDNAPHNVERMFRESVEAITGVHGLSRDDMIYEVAGRLQKFAGRINSGSDVRRVGHKESELTGSLNERIAVYATLFVDDLVYGVYDGEVSLVTKNENELADGFFGATMQCRLASFDNTSEEGRLDEEEDSDGA